MPKYSIIITGIIFNIFFSGVSKPRLTGVSGTALPSARLVSTMIHADISNLHGRYSLMLMQFAQFLDHDITFTPVHRGMTVHPGTIFIRSNIYLVTKILDLS